MSVNRALCAELSAIDAESADLDAHILELLDSGSSEHSAAAIRISALHGPDTSLVLSNETFDSLVDPGRFASIATKATVMAEQIEESRILSERVSRTVRQLDEAQMNVQHALALVEDVVNLKGCAQGVVAALKEDDLVGATGYVRQFHDIASVAAKASADYDCMVRAERDLQSRVLRHFDAAAGAADGAELAKYCALLGPLGLASEGVAGYLSFARASLKTVIGAAGDGQTSGGRTASAEDMSDAAGGALSKLFNGAAAFLQAHVAVCAAALSRADGGAALLQLVHADVEEVACGILRAYVDNMGLPGHAAKTSAGDGSGEGDRGKGGSALGKLAGAVSAGADGSRASLAGYAGGLNELNETLEGVALVMQHVESYDRFVRHAAFELEAQDTTPSAIAASSRSVVGTDTDADVIRHPVAMRDDHVTDRRVLPPQTKLNEALAELGGYYTLLERVQLRASLKRALALDALPPAARAAVDHRAKQATLDALSASGGGNQGGVVGGARVASGLLAAVTASAPTGRGSKGSFGGLTVGGDDAGAVVSSTAVEDAFYIAQCAAQRAVAAGHAQSCGAVVNHVKNSLGCDLFDPLVSRATSAANSLGRGASDGDWGLGGLAEGASSYLTSAARTVAKKAAEGAGKAQGVVAKSAVGDDASEHADLERACRKVVECRMEQLVALNNLEACASCSARLQMLLRSEVTAGFEDGPPLAQLLACVAELEALSTRFGGARDEAIASLAAHLQPRLRNATTELLVDASAGGPCPSFSMDEAKYERHEAHRDGNGWAAR